MHLPIIGVIVRPPSMMQAEETEGAPAWPATGAPNLFQRRSETRPGV